MAEVQMKSDAFRERELNDVLNCAIDGSHAPSDVRVLTGSDGRCHVEMTMEQFDRLIQQARDW